jgi:predicted thioredoxin/glutaredoxin
MTAIETRTALRDTWNAVFPQVPAPAESQFALWLLLHEPEVVRQGLAQLATKFRKVKEKMDFDYMVKYSSSIMNRLSKEKEENRL